MKLEKIIIKNFRQFDGEQEIEFAPPESGKNVTVIHGYNGSGKTALLNAFIWCIYGETTPDFTSPERLESERAAASLDLGDSIEVLVRLCFNHHDSRYIIERKRVSQKIESSAFKTKHYDLDLYKVSHSGELLAEAQDSKTAQNKINRLLPPELYPFFFFNGERVERLASPDAYDRVETGIKTLLDVEVSERGARHLRTQVANELAKELKQLGNDDLKIAVEEELSLKSELSQKIDKLKNTVHEIAAINEEIEDIETNQTKLESVREIAEKRNQLKIRLNEVSDQYDESGKILASAISASGYSAFAESAEIVTSELVQAARQRGELPAKIKPQFVDDLLEKKECICGREILSGTSEYACLLNWRGETGLAEFEEAIAACGSGIKHVREKRNQLIKDLQKHVSSRDTYLGEMRSLQEQISVAEESLGSDENADSEAKNLAERKKRLEVDSIDLKAGKLSVEKSIRELEEKISEVNADIKKLQMQDDKAELVRRQKTAVENVAAVLEEITDIRKEDVRQSLDEQIQEVWSDAAIKDYRAKVTPDYRLLLTKWLGGEEQQVHGASTGEKQVLALSFVGSLVKKAKENYKESLKEGADILRGGSYPLVMDSAFGSLEDDYRQKVSEWIPNLADQVIIMVSKTQWRSEVEVSISNKIGAQYILELHSSKQGAGRDIELNGVNHPYVVSESTPEDATYIRRVD
jgi:DNA sulfur modification protein DndD